MPECLFRFCIVAAVGWLYVPTRAKRDPLCRKIVLVIVIGYAFQYFLRDPLYTVIGDWYKDWQYNRTVLTDQDMLREEQRQSH